MFYKNLKLNAVRWCILPGMVVLICGLMACSKKKDDAATGSVSVTFQK